MHRLVRISTVHEDPRGCGLAKCDEGELREGVAAVGCTTRWRAKDARTMEAAMWA